MNKVWAYDIEIFPNYASFLFIDVEPYMAMYNEIRDIENRHKLLVSEEEKIHRIEAIPHVLFEISSIEGYDVNDLLALLDFVSQNDYLASFNGVSYDDTIIKMLLADISRFTSVADINKKCYQLSKKLVETPREILRNDHSVRMYKQYNPLFISIDVQKVAALDKIFKSLKQTLINLSWHSINDFEMPPIDPVEEGKYYSCSPQAYPYIKKWDRFLTVKHLPPLKAYNRNDVLGVCELFCFLQKAIMLRFSQNERYGINTLSASDSRIASIFIAKYYSEYTGIPFNEYRDLRTYRTRMNIGKIISPLVHFKTVEFNNLLTKLKMTTVSSTNDIDYEIAFNGIVYNIKSGGLHSQDIPGEFIGKRNAEDDSCDEYLEDGDVGSYYPTLTINLNVAPAHLIAEAFIAVTKIMKDQRLQAKADGDHTTADSLKITINVGMFGKFNFEYEFLFDTLCTLIITINGQLMLLMLIERLALAGIQNVSANTDGIVCRIPKDKHDLYYQICNEWAKEVNFLFEYTQYIKYFRLDVNNYITVKLKKDGKLDVKRKGCLNQYLQTEDLKKGFNKPIVPKAVEEYLIHGTPIRDTIVNERNIYLFCITQNVDSSFQVVYRNVIKGKVTETLVQKNIRFYISKTGGSILKKKNDDYSSIVAKQAITVFNDYFTVNDFKDYNVKYAYYIQEAEKLVKIIKSSLKGNTKKVKKNQLNAMYKGLFDKEVMDSIKIPGKKGDMREVPEDQRYVPNHDELDQDYCIEDDESIEDEPEDEEFNEEQFNRNMRDEKFDETDNWHALSSYRESCTNIDDLCNTQSPSDTIEDDNGDLPF